MIKVISNQESNEIQQAQTKRDMKLKATLNSFKVDPFDVKQVMNTVPITNRMYRELEKAKEKERKKKLQEIQNKYGDVEIMYYFHGEGEKFTYYEIDYNKDDNKLYLG